MKTLLKAFGVLVVVIALSPCCGIFISIFIGAVLFILPIGAILVKIFPKLAKNLQKKLTETLREGVRNEK